MNKEYIFKIILIGDSASGKTSFLMKYADNFYNPSLLSTIGVDFKLVKFPLDKNIIKLQIWDTAGQERFKNITKSYLRNKDICFFCFDITNKKSLYNLSYWIDLIDNLDDDDKPIHKAVIGLKSDLTNKRQVDYSDAFNFAKDYDMKYFELSSKTLSSDAIHDLIFIDIIESLVKKYPSRDVYNNNNINKLRNLTTNNKCCF